MRQTDQCCEIVVAPRFTAVDCYAFPGYGISRLTIKIDVTSSSCSRSLGFWWSKEQKWEKIYITIFHICVYSVNELLDDHKNIPVHIIGVDVGTMFTTA